MEWVEEAARLPLAFAQVREDPRIDRHVIEQVGAGARVAMVASGGCTAALIAALPQVVSLTLVDPNPAQLALARLKLALLARPQAERMQILGHHDLDAESRLLALRQVGVDPSIIGPTEVVLSEGPDKAGRYERVFAELGEAMPGDGVAPGEEVSPDKARAINTAFADVMALPNLVALFGEDATCSRRVPFDRHFARRTLDALRAPLARENPFLWQVLRGTFPSNRAYDWLELPVLDALPETRFMNQDMNAALQNASGEFDVIHLSNILDWLSPENAFETLEHAWRALRPGGRVVLRQLNSTLNVESLGGRFEWQFNEARDWLARDRSYFYRELFIGVRP